MEKAVEQAGLDGRAGVNRPGAIERGLVVEDNGDTRSWLVTLLKSAFGDIAVDGVGSASDARAWLASHPEPGRTLALIDLGLPDGRGVDLIREMACQPDIMAVVVTIYDDDAHLFDAVSAGAQGYLLKDQQPETLLRRLMEIEKGEPPLSPAIARRILARCQAAPPAAPAPAHPQIDLTAREAEVLALLAQGLRISDAAAELGLTRHTVAGYVKVIYSKLSISSRAEAALEAHRRGLV